MVWLGSVLCALSDRVQLHVGSVSSRPRVQDANSLWPTITSTECRDQNAQLQSSILLIPVQPEPESNVEPVIHTIQELMELGEDGVERLIEVRVSGYEDSSHQMVLRDGTGDLLCCMVPVSFSQEEGWYRLSCVLKMRGPVPYVQYLSAHYIPLPPPPPALSPLVFPDDACSNCGSFNHEDYDCPAPQDPRTLVCDECERCG